MGRWRDNRPSSSAFHRNVGTKTRKSLGTPWIALPRCLKKADYSCWRVFGESYFGSQISVVEIVCGQQGGHCAITSSVEWREWTDL